MHKNSQINLFITLDEKKIPEKIQWEADDAQFNGRKESKTMMLSLWDKEENVTFSIDLWTKEMTVNEMQIHFYQVLLKMADTFQRATNNSEAAEMIKNFSYDFAEKLKLKTG
jgi:gliding motility-associated protein GldC